ncbi:MAG TPA: response regulator transcription factor [Chitinophagaceae bacterium]|nr:response regulator transcription factor [Chitinophagaceae bacterium]
MKNKFRILVVDDDPDIGTMIKMMLEYRGYNVTVTDRGEQAERLLEDQYFDLMIMDMLLSGINGIDVCARIKKNEATSAIPIMMISAHPNAREICLEAGADEFISKPFDMEDMFSKINKFAAGARASSS